jgi:hypothetical protein
MMPRVKGQKAYLGDGVYVEFDGYALVLTTEDGIRATNTIVLEPEVCDALTAYVASLKPCSHPDLDVNRCTACGEVVFPIPGPGESAE